MKYSKSKGSALVVVVIILSIAIVGVLGFVVWNNFFVPKDQPTRQPESTPVVTEGENENSKNEEYHGEGYTFEYKAEGWKISSVSYELQADDVSLHTNDYEPFRMGIKSGATINIYEYSGTLESQINNVKNFPGAEDLKNITINGLKGFSYNSSYEGVRYHTTLFVNDKLSYDIVYRYMDEGQASTHMDQYELVTSTFKKTN